MKIEMGRKEIDEAILEIKSLQLKYFKVETMFIYRALDDTLKKIGWGYAKFLEEGEIQIT